MQKIRYIPILILLAVALILPACNAAPAEPVIEATIPQQASPAPTASMEPGAATWEIGDNWTYSPQAIWEDVLVGLESELDRGQPVRQFIGTYNLRTREKVLVYELPPGRLAQPPPAVYEDTVVWASIDREEKKQHSGRDPLPNWDVFLLDIKTGEVRQITAEEHAQQYPRIHGDTIVWLDSRHESGYYAPRRYDVYAYDMNTGTETRLTPATTADGQELEISDGQVVWTDNRHGDPEVKNRPDNEPDYNNEIYVYDLGTGRETRLTSYPGNDHYPDIDGDKIVWLRQQDYVKADVFSYDLKTGLESQVSRSGFADSRPSVQGSRVVSVDARESKGNTSGDVVLNGRQGQADIYLYDLETQQETKLTSTVPGKVMYQPVIYGDFVVYEWVGFTGRMVYGVHLDGNSKAIPEVSPAMAACIEMLQQVPVYYEDFQFWNATALREDPELEEMYQVWYDRNLDSLEEGYALNSEYVEYLARSEGLRIIRTEYDSKAVRDRINLEFYRDTNHMDTEVWKSEPSHNPEHVFGGWVLANGLLVRGANNSNVDDYLRVAGGAELSMYDKNMAGLLTRLPEGVTTMVSHPSYPEGIIVSGMSVAKEDAAAFRQTYVYKFESAEATASDDANEYFAKIEDGFREAEEEFAKRMEPAPYRDLTLERDGEFVTWSVTIAEEYIMFMLFYD